MNLAVLATLVSLVFAGSQVYASETPDPRKALLARVDSLCAAAQYRAAVDVARELQTLTRADKAAKTYEIADVERLVNRLEFSRALPDSTQKELARADRMNSEVESDYATAKYDDAQTKVLFQLEVYRRILGKDHPSVAASLNNHSAMLHMRGDLAAAEEASREALEIHRKSLGSNHPDVALDLNNYANILMALNRLQDSKPFAEESLALRRQLFGRLHPDVPMSLNTLGVLNLYLGEFVESEPLIREALAIDHELAGRESQGVATDLLSLASLFQMRGDLEGAEPLHRESLAIYEKILGNEHPYIAANLQTLSTLHRERGDFVEAEELIHKALAMQRKFFGHDHPEIARSIWALALLRSEQGDMAQAEELFRESLAMLKGLTNGNNIDVANCLQYLAKPLRFRGNLPEAESNLTESLSIRRNLLGREHPSIAQCLEEIARVLRDKGDLAGSLEALDEASHIHEAARVRVGSGTERATFQGDPYNEQAALRLELRRANAWDAAERHLGRVMLDLLVASKSRRLTAAESAREDSLLLSMNDNERRMRARRAVANSDSSYAARRKSELATHDFLAAEAEWSLFQHSMAKRHPVESGLPFELARIQAKLDPQTAFLGWLDVEWKPGDNESWGYVIRKTGPARWERLTLPAARIRDRRAEFRARITDPATQDSATRAMLSSLYIERVAPLSKHLAGIEALVVLPSDFIDGVPIEALVTAAGAPLGSQYSISYATSATVYAWLQEKPPPSSASRPGFFVGDPWFARGPVSGESAVVSKQVSLLPTVVAAAIPALMQVFRSAVAGNEAALDSLPRLPSTREEARESAALFPGSTLRLGREATEQDLVERARADELSKYKVLHFATHALTDDKRPEQSALVLTRYDLLDPLPAAERGERVYDGLLTAKEILREWKLDADLVVLSGCETGIGREVSGEGFIGLASAFLQVGARSLIVSLWSVEDRSTSLLLRRFYENWTGSYIDQRADQIAKPMSKVMALREAKDWLRSYRDSSGRTPYAPPYYWAGFVLIGDPR